MDLSAALLPMPRPGLAGQFRQSRIQARGQAANAPNRRVERMADQRDRTGDASDREALDDASDPPNNPHVAHLAGHGAERTAERAR